MWFDKIRDFIFRPYRPALTVHICGLQKLLKKNTDTSIGNAADNTKNAGISEYTSLCTNQMPYHIFISGYQKYPSQLAPLALTDMTYLKSIFLCHSKTALRKLGCPASGSYYFQERRGRTERADRASKIFAFSNILHWKVKGDELVSERYREGKMASVHL